MTANITTPTSILPYVGTLANHNFHTSGSSNNNNNNNKSMISWLKKNGGSGNNVKRNSRIVYLFLILLLVLFLVMWIHFILSVPTTATTTPTSTMRLPIEVEAMSATTTTTTSLDTEEKKQRQDQEEQKILFTQIEKSYQPYYQIPKIARAIVFALTDSNFYENLHAIGCLQKGDIPREIVLVDLNLQNLDFRKTVQKIAGTIYIQFPKQLFRGDYGSDFMESDEWITRNEKVWSPLVTSIVKQHVDVIENEDMYLDELVQNMLAAVDQNFLICHESEPSHTYTPKRFALVLPLNFDQIHQTTSKLSKWEKETRPCVHGSTAPNVDLIFLFHGRPNEFMENVMQSSVSKFTSCFNQVKFEYAQLEGIEATEQQYNNHLMYKLLLSKRMFMTYTHLFFMEWNTMPIIDNWLEEFMYRVVNSQTMVKDLFSFWIKGSIVQHDSTKQDDSLVEELKKISQTNGDQLHEVTDALRLDNSALFSLSADFRLLMSIVAQRELDRPFLASIVKTLIENEALTQWYFPMIQYDNYLVKQDGGTRKSLATLSSTEQNRIHNEHPFAIFVKVNPAQGQSPTSHMNIPNLI